MFFFFLIFYNGRAEKRVRDRPVSDAARVDVNRFIRRNIIIWYIHNNIISVLGTTRRVRRGEPEFSAVVGESDELATEDDDGHVYGDRIQENA